VETMQKRDPEAWMREEYEKLVAASLDWKLRTLHGPSAPRSTVDGKTSIMLCSNNYLNLSNHPKVKEAAKRAVDTHGAGSGSVRPIAGNMDLHEELERRIAKFKRRQAALYYMSGFAGNAGLIPQLAGEGDALFTDELNHGSIIDGVRLTKATRFIYKHSDVADLERALKEADPKFNKLLVISDGVFSMDGDVAPVGDIANVAEEYGAMVYIDDAHGEGVLGEGGRGVASHFHVEDKIQVELGTFSKALGVVGGYVAGSNDLRNYALNKSRTWLLSGSHPPATTAACIAAIDVLETEPQHVERLWENTNYFKKELVSLGFDIGRSVTPITPVMCLESSTAKKLSDRLFQLGVFALPIVYPMVAKDKARIRTIMNAGLTRQDLDEALAAFEKAGKDVGLLT
jgi:glycine C-acetyltransferase